MNDAVTTTHVALIRGINVGGKNPVPMAALREALLDEGVQGVQTYIQSGNVLLAASHLDSESVSALVEGVLRTVFGVVTPVVTATAEALRDTVANAPTAFATGGDAFHRDVVFLHPRLTLDEAWSVVQLRDGVDQAWQGERVIYFRRVSAERTKSKLGKIIGTSPYQSMTIRSWQTTLTLATMLDG